MLDSVQAMSLLTIMEIAGPVLLIAVLIYGTMQWSRRRHGPTEAVREGATRQLGTEPKPKSGKQDLRPSAGKNLQASADRSAATSSADAATRQDVNPIAVCEPLT